VWWSPSRSGSYRSQFSLLTPKPSSLTLRQGLIEWLPMAAETFGLLEIGTAKRLILRILEAGTVSFSGHALAEMRKDKLSTVDCTSVLRGGVVEPGELERGSWRYRVKTNTICVVMAFRSETELVVVTAWRIGR